MRRLLKITAAALGVMALFAGITMWSLYRAATASVPEYDAVLTVDPARIEQDRQAFESQLAALYSDTQSLAEWQSRITAPQINAWLASRLPVDFPDLAKTGLAEPRVLIDKERITIAMQSTVGKIAGIVTVTVRPFLTEQDDLGLDIQSAKIGRLSLPMEGITAKVRQARLEQIAPVRWSPTEQSAVLLIDIDRIVDAKDRDFRLTGVDLREGELLLSGESPLMEKKEPQRNDETTKN